MSKFMVNIEISRIDEAEYEKLLERIEDVCIEFGVSFFAHLGEPDYDGDAEDIEAES